MSDDPEDFDFEQWLSGATTAKRSVRLYARADVLAEIDELDRRLAVASRVPVEERGITDDDESALEARRERLYEQFEASAVNVTVQGRSQEWRDAVTKRLKKQGVTDEAEVMLHQIAESVVSPTGMTVDALKRFREISEPQTLMLANAFIAASTQAPRVSAPFSQGSSRTRDGRR